MVQQARQAVTQKVVQDEALHVSGRGLVPQREAGAGRPSGTLRNTPWWPARRRPALWYVTAQVAVDIRGKNSHAWFKSFVPGVMHFCELVLLIK